MAKAAGLRKSKIPVGDSLFSTVRRKGQMPIIYRKNTDRDTFIAVWEITEPLDYFQGHLELSPEYEDFLRSVHPKRALEWAASRMLISRITKLPDSVICTNDLTGKPFIPGHPERHISISHSGVRAAVAISGTPVGIDLQIDTPKVERIAPKFLSGSEASSIRTNSGSQGIQLAWSAKEAMFKLYGKGQVDFRKHLGVRLPEKIASSGIFSGWIRKPGVERECHLSYLYLNNYILVQAEYAE